TTVTDPLSQLVVDDPSSKGSKRKTLEETTRISIQIPKKGGGATAESDETNAPPNPPKKKRGTRSGTGRALLQGGSAQNPTAGSDAVAQKDAEVEVDNVQAPRPFCCPMGKKGK
ncbi:hypothetical protein A2U01_0061875, partial [Trifolium medium]|nr:hypothetical protein [Trifolium medium]